MNNPVTFGHIFRLFLFLYVCAMGYLLAKVIYHQGYLDGETDSNVEWLSNPTVDSFISSSTWSGASFGTTTIVHQELP